MISIEDNYITIEGTEDSVAEELCNLFYAVFCEVTEETQLHIAQMMIEIFEEVENEE